jgi:hypothetical protein
MANYQEILNKNLLNVFVEILRQIEKKGLKDNNHLYITFNTQNPKNLIPNWLTRMHPNEMTIIIQHEYYHFSVNKEDFNIGLSFNNKKSDLKISFDSILSFADPSANFGLNFDFNISDKDQKIKQVKKKRIEKNSSSNIINLSKYKKNQSK